MSDINKNLHLLMLTPWLPYPPDFGGSIRIYQLMKNLSRKHRVSLLTYVLPGEEERVPALKEVCEAVHTVASSGYAGKRKVQLASLFSSASYQRKITYSPQMQAKIDTLMASGDYDIVQVEFSQMGCFRFGKRAIVLLDEHNIEYELLYRMYRTESSSLRRFYNGLEYVKFRREERQCWSHVDACIFTSPREEEILRQHLPHKPTTVAPNGVDVDYFQPTPEIPVDPDSIVFTGLINYRPNTDAILFFVREVLPLILRVRPTAVFSIVGKNPPEEIQRLAGPNVVITGQVPDVRPYLARAAAVVVPLRMGSGTRLKVFEGLAMGKAMVSTSLGCEGIDVCHGEHLLIADEPVLIAQSVLRLIGDPVLAQKLGERGRALAQRNYSWATVADHLEEFYTWMRYNRAASPDLRGDPAMIHG